MTQIYKLFILKEKAILETQNKFKIGRKLFFGFCWCPDRQFSKVQKALEACKQGSAMKPTFAKSEHTLLTPPTLIPCNDFLWPFQEIVNTYGIPNYKEFNPAVFACVTFPFLFGIMFGDIAHGGVLFLVGAFLSLFGHKVPALSFAMPLRYILLLMGFFATFAGFVYNDMMAIPVQLSTSCYVGD